MSAILNLKTIEFIKSDGSKIVTDMLLDRSTSEAIERIESLVPSEYVGKANRYKKTEVTISASGWSGSDAPYSNTISVTDVTADSDVQVMLADSVTKEQVEGWTNALVMSATQSSGSITLKAFGEKPSTNIPVIVLVGSDVM